MAHQARNDVDRRTGLEQFARDAVPEAMNPDVNAFRCFDSKLGHRPKRQTSRHSLIRPPLGIDEEISISIRAVVFGEPIVQVFGEQIGHAHRRGARAGLWRAFLPSRIV